MSQKGQRRSAAAADLSDAAADTLANELRQTVHGEVRFDAGSRALYATDGSLYRQVPIGVVVPTSIEDVTGTLRICHRAGVPVLPRGAGTSLAGQCCNVAVVIDMSKHLNAIVALEPTQRRARVQPGCVLDDLRDAAERHHLTFGPDPSTHTHNTLGGMIGNNSCGVHSIMSGRTADNVHALDVMTGDGLRMRVGPTSDAEFEQIIAGGGRRAEIYQGLRRIRDSYADEIRTRYPRIPRRVSGYNLDELLPENGFNVARALVGSEGTCVTILEAELDLIDSPPARVLVLLGFSDVYTAADQVPEIMKFGPTGLEGIDDVLVNSMRAKGMHARGRTLLPAGDGFLFVEFGGDTGAEAADKARALMDRLAQLQDAPQMQLVEDAVEQKRMWHVRESGLGATSRDPNIGDTFPGWEDAAVPPERLGDYLRDFRQLMHSFNYEAALYGHFGDGCIHCRINFDLRDEPGLAKWQAFMGEATDLVQRYGGSLSGEHGDGQVRAELLPRMFGPTLMQAMREFKGLWDPAGMMNPGKVVEPYPIATNLRSGPGTTPPVLETIFAFSEDQHSFAAAADRCVGIGNCRAMTGGVMCPSYRATRDEQHSTRGRTRLLFEMLKGEPVADGWRSEAIRDALDLCLACKGCKRDCPVDVDMATLKAEFMSHHYRRRLRPRAAYSMGLIWWWSRIAAHMPGLVNAVLHAPGISRVVKAAAGVAAQRSFPRYANETFTRWHRRQPRANAGLPRVLLWPDTFNNHFYPESLKSARRVLEAAGYEVVLPSRPLCCARPLFAEGMLDQARRQLGQILDSVNAEATAQLPLVGLEPSCVASFRDELPQLFAGDERAHALADRSYMLGEFLDAGGYQPASLEGHARFHIHCHQYASLDPEADRRLLAATGLEVDVMDAGCCGMAGSFGFDAERYDVAQKIAEHQFLPQIRDSDEGTLLVTNGFSCREQILQSTGRRSVTLAEVLDDALAQGQPLEVLAPADGGR